MDFDRRLRTRRRHAVARRQCELENRRRHTDGQHRRRERRRQRVAASQRHGRSGGLRPAVRDRQRRDVRIGGDAAQRDGRACLNDLRRTSVDARRTDRRMHVNRRRRQRAQDAVADGQRKSG